jgi:hypothetical protein
MNKYSEFEIKDMLEFLKGNIIVIVGGQVFLIFRLEFSWI